MPKLKAVGRNVPRAEGVEKLTGQARYVDDLSFPGMLHGATVRSTMPHARIVEIERDLSFDWSGFTVVNHRDVPAGGKNVVAMIAEDQPYLAVDEVRHQAEPLLLLAHADRARLAAGLTHIKVHYQPLPAVLDFETAAEVLKEISISKGDIDAGREAAPAAGPAKAPSAEGPAMVRGVRFARKDGTDRILVELSG